ncbi:unnamed protein product [Prunus brigantina]
MAEVYLEKTSQQQQLKVSGTHIVAIPKEDCCESIYVAVCTRATCPKREGFILKDDAKNYLYMGNCNVFATMAGISMDCENMLNFVNGVMERAWEDVVNNGIHCAQQIARNYIGWWETCSTPYLFQWCTQYIFQGCTVMVGWDASGLPYIYDINRDGVQHKTKSEVCDGFVNGSGSEKVYEYFRDCNVEVQSSEELLVSVERALLYASLFDEKSGGDLRVFNVKKEGVRVVYQQSVLKALFEHYNALASYLRKSLFFLFHTDHYKYTHEHNLYVDQKFREIFPEDYVRNVVLKIGKQYTVRLVHFKEPVDELYEQLRIENRDRNLSPQVEAQMEQLGLEQFQKDGVLFGMPTQMLVGGLLDVLSV